MSNSSAEQVYSGYTSLLFIAAYSLLDLALLLETLFLVGNPFVLLAALSAAAGAAGVNFLTPIFPSVITNCDG